MTLTAQQTKLDELYRKNFGEDRGASFGTTGGANYWIDTHNPQTDADWIEIDRMLAASDEGQKHRGEVEGYTAGNIYIGGIDPTKSIESQSRDGFWGDHFRQGGVFEHQNAAAKAQAIADDIGFTPSEAYFNNTLGGGNNNNNNNGNNENTTITTEQDPTWTGLTLEDLDEWWSGKNQDKSSGGMDDFMRFMMFMSMMRPQGGHSGSQYGYGGLHPGGVMSAYNPMDDITSAISAFQSIPGIGGGSGLNDGNAAAA